MSVSRLSQISNIFASPSTVAFSVLFTLEPLHRSIIITVIPLMTLEHLETPQAVSFFFFSIGVFALIMSMAVPWLITHIKRRGTFFLGIVIGISAMILFMWNGIWSLSIGMMMHLFAASCIDVSLNLYMMEHIKRRSFGGFEPIRMFFLALAWCIGPFLGVYLRNKFSVEAPFLLGILVLVMFILYFVCVGFKEGLTNPAQRMSLTNPLLYLPRFFLQPRLRLVYMLSLMRSGWWTMFFIYVPIYCVSSGLGESMGGALVSLGTACVMATPLLRGSIRKYGIRRILQYGYVGTGLMTIFLSFIMHMPLVAVILILGCSVFAMLCDSIGNALFYRAVHFYERSEMATVFGSYRQMASLTFPGIFSAVLIFFPLPAVFASTGILMLTSVSLTRYISKKMN